MPRSGNALIRLNTAVVREAARGLWRCTIYPALGIEVGQGKHGPCPHCGGKDRFRCDDLDGRGTFFCTQCGAGDGFAMVQKVVGCDFPEALRLVAGVLRLDPSTPPPSRQTPKRQRPDPPALAFRFELAALDRRLRAERIIKASTRLHVATLNDAELDRALGLVAQAWADEQRAELFEGIADDLRIRDYHERGTREQQRRIA